MKQTLAVGGLSSIGGLHAVVIVVKQQLSLIAMSDNCMEFMHLQLHVQMPDDDTSTRQAIIATICLTGFLYIMCRLCKQNHHLHYLPYMRSHLFTADASSAYIGKERKWTCIAPIVSITRPLSAQMWITQSYLKYTTSAFSLYKHSLEGNTAANSFTHLATHILLILLPTEGRRLSWPGWLTHSGRITHEVVTRQP